LAVIEVDFNGVSRDLCITQRSLSHKVCESLRFFLAAGDGAWLALSS
jgi:hypothetical protein